MHRSPHTLAFTALILLVACPRNDDNVGTIADGGGCPAPNVWRYEQSGCDGQVQPICGQAGGDACLAHACACDGESLSGCDYFSKPYQGPGLCPGACFTPTHNLQVLDMVQGCACDPATDQPQCVTFGAGPTGYGVGFTCTGGVWTRKSLPCNLGKSCDVGAAVPPAAAGFNLSAPQCSIGLCLKPVDQSTTGAVDTTAFCTSHCNTDDDCAGGRNRDPSDPNDKTCTSGYTCGMPFVKGDLCCQNLCVCKDFTGGASIPTPIACQDPGYLTCNQ